MNQASKNPHLLRNTLGGVVGNVLEWYDFAVFGYFAPIIGAQFFPSDNPLAMLINAFGVFAAGYMMRPIGGIIFGYIGDKLGRKRALLISVSMMAISATLMGLLPTHAQVGLLAPILLVALRLIQGTSVGGELIGSISFVTEIAPEGKRGFYGSTTLCSAVAGIMVGSLVATIMHTAFDDAALQAWAWRIPFLAGFIIGAFGLWMRKGMIESPDFEAAKKAGEIKKNPIILAIRTMPRSIAQVFAIVAVMGCGIYMFFVWWPTYLKTIVNPPVDHALMVNTISMAVLLALTLGAGWLSDKIGPKKVYLISCVGLILFTYPLFALTDYGVFGFAFAAQLGFALLNSGVQGALPALMVGMFPTHMRYSAIGIGYNVALALFGGTAPIVSTWLIEATHDIASPAYYFIGIAIVSLIATLALKDQKTATT